MHYQRARQQEGITSLMSCCRLWSSRMALASTKSFSWRSTWLGYSKVVALCFVDVYCLFCLNQLQISCHNRPLFSNNRLCRAISRSCCNNVCSVLNQNLFRNHHAFSSWVFMDDEKCMQKDAIGINEV